MVQLSRKKVLIISWGLPIRIIKLAKYLSEYGWAPIIVTAVDVHSASYQKHRDLEGVNIITANYDSIRERIIGKTSKVLSGNSLHSKDRKKKRLVNSRRISHCAVNMIKRISSLPLIKELVLEPSDWYKAGKNKSIELLKCENIDLLFSTYGPAVNHMIASTLQKQFSLPWAADFRDLWTQNPYSSRVQPFSYIDGLLEKRVLKNASRLVTVSEPLAKDLGRFHLKQANVITNGFDESDYKNEVPLSRKFLISYTGSIYPEKRDPTPLLQALSELKNEKRLPYNGLEVQFYGDNVSCLSPLIHQYDLEELVKINGPVKYEQSVKKQTESTVLLLLSWNNALDIGVYTTKVFEYLRAGRPILAIAYKGGVIDDLLTETNSGILATSSSEIKQVLLKWFEEFSITGDISSYWAPKVNLIEKYSRHEQAKIMASIFNEIV